MLRPYRNKIVLASKCGIRFDETATTVNKPLIPDGRLETIKASIEGSLMRLNTDHLDLYYWQSLDKWFQGFPVLWHNPDSDRNGIP